MTMKKFVLSLLCLLTVSSVFSQLYMTRTGTISFHSHTMLEDVDAVNNKVYAVIDLTKKNIAFSMQVKEFSFKKKLMQEHFNENYIESDKYPKSTFTGLYTGDVDATKDGSYPVTVKGKLTLHGVTKDIEVPGSITVASGSLSGVSSFKLNPTDFKIDIPFIVRNKIEKENTVKVNIGWNTKK